MRSLSAKCSIIIMMIILTTKLYSQVDTSTTQKLLQYIMQPLDKNQVPTGFLEEYGCPILPMGTFNGVLTDSNRIDRYLWRTLYFQLQTAWCKTGTNPMPAITTVNTTIKQNTSSSLPVPVPLLIGQYDNVKSNAFSSNLLSYNSSTRKVYDVAGRPQSPYITQKLFAACAEKKETKTGSETFIIKSNLIWNNTGKTITQLQINFANGQGFQTITIGTPISVSYSDTGYKRWTIKATLSDNSILQCYNDYYVFKASGAAARYQADQTVVPVWGTINAVGGVHSGATIRVNFSNRSRTNTLRKPLIVVEGYDVSMIAPNLQPNYDIVDFIEAINEPRTSYDLNNQLDDIAGYDLVFVDFNDGADDIVRNAAVVREVINRVNANKVLDGRFGNIRQQNVVMGLSMGGLCARYALADMTKNFPGMPTEARLLITHDSPHRGANVPLGLQYLLRMVGGAQLFGSGILDVFPNYNEAIGLLNAPATQQLLTYRSLTHNSFANNSFLGTTYRNMITFNAGDPQPAYRFISTSLGNECARPVYNPYTQLLNIGLDGFIFYFPLVSYRLRTIAEVYALPATGSTSKIARFKLSSKFKLFGFITISKDYYDNTAYAPGSHLAIDGVPGAVSPFASVTVPSFNFLFPIPGVFGFLGYVSANTSGTPGDFTFVSTASALDASPYTTAVFSEKYVNGVNQNFPSASQTFIAQETTSNNPSTTNNVHIRFTARNSRWLFNEMENLPNLENCSAECSNPYYIEGVNSFCNTATYSVPGLQRGGNVNWNVTPSGIVNIAQANNIVTLTKVNSGNITLSATITNSCNSTPITITKVISVGSPVTIASSINGCNGEYQIWNLSASPTTNGSNWNWSVSYLGNNSQITIYSPTSPSTLVSVKGGGTVRLNYTDACGVAKSDGVTVYSTCYSSFFTASPNPAGDEVTINATDQSATAQTTGSSAKQKIYKVEIVDQTGNKRKEFEFKQGISNTTLNIADLPSGLYTIRAFNGTAWSAKQLLKN